MMKDNAIIVHKMDIIAIMAHIVKQNNGNESIKVISTAL